MLHAVWTGNEIHLHIDNLALKENGLNPRESVIPQSVTGDPFAAVAENHLS